MSKRKSSGIVSQEETITPKQAEAWINEMEQRIAQGLMKQRPVRWRAVTKYAQDMRLGNWLVTHQGIAWNTEGDLIDGQNRLRAIMEAAIPVTMMVTRGVPKEVDGRMTMDTIDLGVPRSIWQAMQISHGYGGEALEMSSLARNIGRFVLTNPARKHDRDQPISTAQVIAILEKLAYAKSAERLRAIVPNKKLRQAGIVAPWCWYHKVRPKKAEAFATDFIELNNLGKGHPALLLHNLVTLASHKRYRRASELMEIVANALEAYETGESLVRLTPSSDAHAWLLRLNWPDVKKITDMLVHEEAIDMPNAAEQLEILEEK